MKVARATTEDINALADLASAVEAMQDGNIPPEDGEDEWEYIGPPIDRLTAQRHPAITAGGGYQYMPPLPAAPV